MKLYDNAFSPFARKVRMVLEHKGLPFEAFDALQVDARAQLLAANPRGEVPVLEDGGVVIVNSSDIVAYLDQRYPEPRVLPADAAARVEARAWERLADTLLDAITHDVSIWTWPFLERSDAVPEGLREAAARDLRAVYERLDGRLAGREFVCGALSVADFALFPHLSAVRFLGIPFSRDEHPRLHGWYRRLRSHPVFSADLLRVRAWLQRAASGPTIDRIVWRGDRIEWLLANGGHRWFLHEIENGRIAWPGESKP